ncbi:arsenate reductase (glutaredoxin) [Kordiimonas sp. SCSIO 12610]|uniref:arsenate reductase (glutaredoxin) n=1 Tax=Kordiimonas sp. SCSIO 12610 TaxID=2829597 RepID=UPI00210B725B|nr:arsenate reductase (glutaredoxin) [Kordiimonas sp. SCSIO 12610]UTW55501.1 arsenate reductase (glutaredoxin) [Kordiimonas sp. SCSIO 12610]
MSLTIWHNPRCSKSRQTLALIEEKGLTPEVRLYLDDAPTAEDIKNVLDMLGIEPRALMRTGEADYKDQGLSSVSDHDALIEAMVKTPKLIERPVVIKDGQARLGRPPENVLEIL